MEVKTVKISELIPHPKNPRIHPDSALDKLVKSIKEFGWTNPILCSKDGIILAGHARVKAAKKAGLDEVPVIYLPFEGAKATAYLIADNKLQDETDWDLEKLKDLLIELDTGDFDVELTGFAEAEVEDLMTQFHVEDGEEQEKFDLAKALQEIVEPRIKPGEVWQLGVHRLICGDSTDMEIWGRLLSGSKVDLVVTSPPYNMGIKYASYKDKRARNDYLDFLRKVGKNITACLAPGRFVAWNVGVSPESYPHYHVVILEECGLQFYRQIVWEKAGVPYPMFQSTLKGKKARHYKPNHKHEMIYILCQDAGEETNLPMVECPVCDSSGFVQGMVNPVTHEMMVLMTWGKPEKGGKIKPSKKYANDVWHIMQAAATTDLPTLGTKAAGLRKGGKESHMVKAHPAVFPVELPKAVMVFLTAEGETVLDPFCGAGSTIIAAEQMGRVGYGIELDPIYCELTMLRWEAATGQKAVKIYDPAA